MSKGVRTQVPFLAPAGLLVLASGVAAGVGLGQPSLWVDEAYSWLFVSLPWPEMLRAVRLDAVNPPFYYLYTKFFTTWLGTSEVALRMPSLLAHLLGLIGSLWLGNRLAGRPGAIAAGWFWGFHPMLMWFARDARPYSLVAALSVLGLALFHKIRHQSEPRPSLIAGSSVVVALGLLTHYFYLLFIAIVTLLGVRDMRRRNAVSRGWLLALLLAMIPLMAWIWWFLQLPNPSFGIGWIRSPGPIAPLATVWNLMSGYGGAFGLGTMAFGGLAAVLFTIGASRMGWDQVAITLAVPLLAVWVLSQVRPVYIDRYFAVLLPFVATGVAHGGGVAWQRRQVLALSGPRGGALTLGLALIIGALGAALELHSQPAYRKEDWRALAAWLGATSPSAKEYLSEPEASLPLRYYGVSVNIENLIENKSCHPRCIWILRQPFTYVHAFTQSVPDPLRSAWRPDPPAGCVISQQAGLAGTGIDGWLVECDD